jgi:hypothetical protein
MKNTLYFLILFLLITGCSVKESPIFIKVDNVKIISFAADTIRLKADAFFENPNIVGGTISTDKLKIIINEAEVAQVSSEEFKVPARDNFTVPLTAVIPTKRIFKNNENGILGGLINSLVKKTIKVQIKGDLKYKVLGFSNVYYIDKTEDIKIKL